MINIVANDCLPEEVRLELCKIICGFEECYKNNNINELHKLVNEESVFIAETLHRFYFGIPLNEFIIITSTEIIDNENSCRCFCLYTKREFVEVLKHASTEQMLKLKIKFATLINSYYKL